MLHLVWQNKAYAAVLLLLSVHQILPLEPEICITFIESESPGYDFKLRCNFTNAPDITNITWTYPSGIYPNEADRFQVHTILDDVADGHLTELSVSHFNDTLDGGEYFCIAEGNTNILFGGHFLLNDCEDISMDPAFVELAGSVDEVTLEVAEDIFLLTADLFDSYETSELKQNEIQVFVDVMESAKYLNFTERNQTINILRPYLDVSAETLSITQLQEDDFSNVIASMEATFTNAANILDEDVEDTIIINTPNADVYIGAHMKTETTEVVHFDLDEFTSVMVDDVNIDKNTLNIDISNVNEEGTVKIVVLQYTGDYGSNETRHSNYDEAVEVPNSDILVIRLISEDGQLLSVPVNFTLKHKANTSLIEKYGNNVGFKCSFIDDTKEPIYWSQMGCTTKTESTKQWSNCMCNHTTAFAVLMKVTTDDYELSTTHTIALSWIMYIGCGISIVALLLALATFTYVGLTDRIKIHVCLCATLLVAESLMLFGINMTEPPALCTTIAILLHFSFLSVFAWMLVEGIHMYVMIIRVFGSENVDFNYYYVVGWAVPVVVVGASVGAKLDGYGNENSCWLDVESGLIWAFVGPSVFVILINFLILLLVVRVIKRATNAVDDEIAKAKTTIKGIVVLLPLLGVTWVFGLFAIGSATLAFQYIFSILNSFQGLFIFIFYCLMNTEVRSSFARKRKQHQLTNGDLHSTLDESRTGKMSRQSKVTAISTCHLQGEDDKQDVISVTLPVSNSKSRSGTPNGSDEGIDMNMPGGIDEEYD